MNKLEKYIKRKLSNKEAIDRMRTLWTVILLILSLTAVLVGVTVLIVKELKKVEPITFKENEVIRFEDGISVDHVQFALYAIDALTAQDIHEEDWDSVVPINEKDGVTFDSNLKCMIVEDIALTVALANDYLDSGDSLTDTEIEQIKAATDNYVETFYGMSSGEEVSGLMVYDSVYKYQTDSYMAYKNFIKTFGEEATIADESVYEKCNALTEALKGDNFTYDRNVNWDILSQIDLKSMYDIIAPPFSELDDHDHGEGDANKIESE